MNSTYKFQSVQKETSPLQSGEVSCIDKATLLNPIPFKLYGKIEKLRSINTRKPDNAHDGYDQAFAI
jgi:hypothetical protein